jgi:glutaredoxin
MVAAVSKIFVVYSKPGCPSCDNAKKLIVTNGDTYLENVIGRDVSREEFMEMFPSVKSVPLILEEEAGTIGGFTDLVEWYKESAE